MLKHQINCPHCRKHFFLENAPFGTQIPCEFCHRAIDLPPREEHLTPDPGKEIPELQPSKPNMERFQSGALIVFLISLLIGISLLFQNNDQHSSTFTLTLVASMGVISGFVWAYLEFARNLKSHPN